MLTYPWRLAIGVARTALGTGCLVLHLASTLTPFSWGLLIFAAFLAYALFALRRGQQSDGAPLLTLAVDTVAFLLWLVLAPASGPGLVFWLALAVGIYIFLISCAVLNQDWPVVLAVAGSCLLVASLVPARSIPALLAAMIGAALLAGVWGLDRRYLEHRLSRASRNSVTYRYEAQRAREDERTRIAADFHDGPLQSFVGLQMRLEVLRKLLVRDVRAAAEDLTQLQALCHSQVIELRAFVRSMRPADIQGSSLGASISRIVEQFQKDTGISASFSTRDHAEPAADETSVELLNIVREALTNVQKHAQASRVTVAMGRNSGLLEIVIDDNGSGFPFAGSYTLDEMEKLRLGPVSIRRRVRALEGDLRVESRPGHGSGLRIRVTA